MIPESVAVRQRGSFDFVSTYDNLCALQDTVPLLYVKAHIKSGILDINGDKVRMIDWSPILNSVKINKNLRYIAIRSYFQQSAANASGRKAHYFKRRTPAICMKDVTVWTARSLASCLCITKALKCIDLQGVPLREKDVQILAKAIAKNSTLTHILLDYCQISDKGVNVLCHALKNHPTVSHVSLAGCNITATGAEFITKLIKHQSNQRHSDAWAEGLRYRVPNLNCMGGLRRITLNSNPMIGDSGITMFADALKDDLWLKALDLQHCGISSDGAKRLMETVKSNKTLVVLDIRRNPMVDSGTLRSVLGVVLMNANEKDEAEYPWIKEEPPKDPYKTNRYRPSRQTTRHLFPKKVNYSKKTNSPQVDGVPCVVPAGKKGYVPWRTAVRASQHQLGLLDDDESDSDEVLHIEGQEKEIAPTPAQRFARNIADDAYVKDLKINLLDAQRKLIRAKENEQHLNNKVMALEVENSRLRKELTDTLENSKLKSQIEDEVLLDSIDQSFNKFHEFLNMLSDLGLGSLIAEAGLGGFSLKPSVAKSREATTTSNKKKKPKQVEQQIESQKSPTPSDGQNSFPDITNNEDSVVDTGPENPIIIEGSAQVKNLTHSVDSESNLISEHYEDNSF